MNTKASLYITGESEFLNLQNVDFRTPGALFSDAGSTPILAIGTSTPVTGIAEMLQYVSANTTYSPFANTAIPLVTDRFFLNTFDAIYAKPLNFFGASSRPLRILDYLFHPNGNRTSFAYMNGGVYGCNGLDFWAYNLVAGLGIPTQFSLPKPMVGVSGVLSGTAGAGGLSGFLVMYYSLVRSDGFMGPYTAITYALTGVCNLIFNIPYGPNLQVGMSLPLNGLSFGNFALVGIQAWASLNGSQPQGFSGAFPLGAAGASIGATVSIGYGFTNTTPQVGVTAWGYLVQPLDFQGSFLYGLGPDQGQQNIGYTGSGNPALATVFANQLFTAVFGSSGSFLNNKNLSTVVFSNPGTPEQANYQNFFQVAIEDPDPLTAMKPYFTYLMIAKAKSLWALSGTGPDTFNLAQISNSYGVLNNNACCTWNQVFWFLDEKGIMEFNGAIVQPTSYKVQAIFDSMNIAAAKGTAIMTHIKERNEVWTAIPTNGATFNNLIVIYDYLANAWRTRTVPNGSVTTLVNLTEGDNKQTTYYGGLSGMIGAFGSSYIGDGGAAFTSVIKSRFIDDLGNSVQKLYRRFYLDASIAPGQTLFVQANFYLDKSVTYAYSTTMVLGSFQNRIDFGLSAKSVAVELIYNGATFLQLNGFTLEYRYLRNV